MKGVAIVVLGMIVLLFLMSTIGILNWTWLAGIVIGFLIVAEFLSGFFQKKKKERGEKKVEEEKKEKKKKPSKVLQIIPTMLFIGLLIVITIVIISLTVSRVIDLRISLGILGLLIALFFQSLMKIPADPPHKAVLTILGKRTSITKDEGWRIFPFRPLCGAILVEVTKINQDLKPQTVRTPDLGVLEVPVSLTWTPDSKHLIEFLNCGREEGVRNILADIVRERIREWGIAVEEGPQTFEEAMKAQKEAVAILVKAIAGEALKKISSSIPTWILMKYFSEPQKKPTPSEAKKWGENWGILEEALNQEPDGRERIREEIKERMRIIGDIKRGNGVQPISQLGIILNRFNIGEIIIKPGTALETAAEAKVKEAKEREAEMLELTHVKNRILELKEELKINNEQALEILQTERGKVKKEIKEVKANISAETRGLVEKIVGAFKPT